jgi:hypothetical protein
MILIQMFYSVNDRLIFIRPKLKNLIIRPALSIELFSLSVSALLGEILPQLRNFAP